MLPGGHVATTYITIKTAEALGASIDPKETLIILAAGLIPDIDLFFGMVNGKTGEKHHQQITHTPIELFGIAVFLAVLLKLGFVVGAISFFVMILHLFLDDLEYQLSRFRLIRKIAQPQINWLFPFTSYPQSQGRIESYTNALKAYLKSYPIPQIEVGLILIAVLWYFF